jgi:predicted GNAT family N-acyltransferase
MVEDFHSPSSTKLVGLVENPTYEHTTHTRSNSFVENVTPNTPMQRRTSKRESKQRSVSLNPISVRYEMELVPRIQKNLNFYPSFNTKRSASFNSPKSGEEAPFFESVLWKPSKRKDWEDCLSELVAVCTSAGLRQYIALHTGKRGKKPQFVPPLSREYIRDRIDIDDPLRGVQVRHATQGWLQGFLLWTNFTTWTHYFTWDSRHELAGVQKCQHAKKDADGTLAEELQALPRTGSPLDAGVIFESVAEIALLGGLGCGELLLRMALEEIIQSGQYQYVVLQATVGSRTFYERFGFQRVGAVCRYGDQGMLPTLETPVQGYRHWTHANECQKSLDMHGGPSYMMVLKLADCTENMPKLLQVLDHYCVQDRPRIAATPMALTPKALKKLKRPSSGYTTPELPNLTPTTKRVFATTANMQPATLPAAKRPRTFDTMTSHTPMPTTTHFMTTPPAKTTLSYAEKQYQSVWLAVPPTAASTTGVLTSKQQRKPPRSRSVKNNSDTKKKKKQKSEVKLLPNPSPLQKQVVPSDKIQSVDRATLCKQKVKSYPRDRLHYYNKIVTAAVSSAKKQYYFVLHYNEPKKLVTLCPMAVKGILSGRRQGRPRFQWVLQETSANWISGAAKDYTPVEAFMVMKTPIVAQEASDVLGA